MLKKLSINNTDIHFQLDTGAKCNVISVFDCKKKPESKQTTAKADTVHRSYSGQRIEPEGIIILPLHYKDSEFWVTFYVVDTKSQSVLSGGTCEEIGLVKRISRTEKDYPEVFEGLGCLPGTYCITSK